MKPTELMNASPGLYKHVAGVRTYYVLVMQPGTVFFLGTEGKYRGHFHPHRWSNHETFTQVPSSEYTVNFHAAEFVGMTMKPSGLKLQECTKPGVYRCIRGDHTFDEPSLFVRLNEKDAFSVGYPDGSVFKSYDFDHSSRRWERVADAVGLTLSRLLRLLQEGRK